MNNLYIIEGTSNSGKTTTCNKLKDIQNMIIIPEFMNSPKAPKPSINLKEELINQKKFLELEKERYLLARKYLDRGQNVFLERSYLSILAVSYAFEKLGKYSAYNNALELYGNILNSNWYIEPSMFFFLTYSYEECKKRNLNRGKQLSENWIKEDFDFYQKEFYLMISDSIKNKLWIDTTAKELDYATNVILKNLNLRRKL